MGKLLLSRNEEGLRAKSGQYFPLNLIAVPKDRLTTRYISQLSLGDTLKYTALVVSIAREIERARLSKSIVFSNRFKSSATVMVNRKTYNEFRIQSNELSKSGTFQFKLITDISNFYDRINLHKLQQILIEIGCDAKIAKKLHDALIVWSGQHSFGLPVGSDASRLLAEAMLINVDKELKAHKIKFIRYVDDFRIFARSRPQAYEALQHLNQALWREGLFLNSGKTKLICLDDTTQEEVQGNAEFDPIDEKHAVEQVKLVKEKYVSKIARYYKYPGKEAIKLLRTVKLDELAEEILDPNVHEDKLKLLIKASIYADEPNFSNLAHAMSVYPHLIPYVADAVTKEHELNPDRFDKAFRAEATKYFRSLFSTYQETDYFRIQAARAMVAVDDKFGGFLSKEIFSISVTRQILLSQVIYLLGGEITRTALLKLLTNFSSFGDEVKFAIIWCLKEHDVVTGDERKARLRNLRNFEPNGFFLQLMRV